MSHQYRVLIDQGTAALAQRDHARAVAVLSEAADLAPPAEMAWIALANARLALGHTDAAEAALDRQLEVTPREVGALLLKAWLREQAEDARAASSFYRTALNQAALDGVPPPLVGLRDHAGRFLQATSGDFERYLIDQVGNQLSSTMQEAIELLTGKRQLFLQEPSVFYYPGLPQKRFYDPDQFTWFAPMLALLPEMQAELAGVMEQGGEGFTPYVQRTANRPAPNNPLLDHQDWTAFHFWRDGAVVDANAIRCPATVQALAHAPMPQVPGRSPNAHWSRLLPGAHIAPHVGMLNTRLICHIPILTAPDCWLRVGSETRTWDDGVPLVFDDSINHEARNQGQQQRVILLFEIWRPEIDPRDREAITRIFEAIGDYE